MNKGFFVTGTDTGVGKTVTAGVLIAALRKKRLNVCGMKPLESGCRLREGRLVPADGSFLRDVAGVDEPLENVTPCCFNAPLAPMPAAALEHREVEIPRLLRVYEGLRSRYDAVVVEGIGGLLVPMAEDYFVVDLVRDMGLPLVVVASPFLGTLNHTLLTVERALSASLPVAGVILCSHRPPEGTLAEKTNPGVLERLLPVPLLGTLPHLGDLSPDALAAAAEEHLEPDVLLRLLA